MSDDDLQDRMDLLTYRINELEKLYDTIGTSISSILDSQIELKTNIANIYDYIRISNK